MIMRIKGMKKYLAMLMLMMVVTIAAVVALPTLAFADPYIDVEYFSVADQQTKSESVDLGALTPSTLKYGYEYQKFDDASASYHNHIVATNSTVLLEDVFYQALLQGDDEGDFNLIWNSGAYLEITTTDGPYIKYTGFTYENLTAPSYFYGGIYWNTLTPFPATPFTLVSTVIALNDSSVDMADSPTNDADSTLNKISVFSPLKAPRLLWGFLNNNPSSTEIGGNRLPSDILSIKIVSGI
jgi:hypothetical protein